MDALLSTSALEEMREFIASLSCFDGLPDLVHENTDFHNSGLCSPDLMTPFNICFKLSLDLAPFWAIKSMLKKKKHKTGRHNKHGGSLSDYVGAPSQTKSMKIHETKSMKIAQDVSVCSEM